MIHPALLDTDVLSAIMRGQPTALIHSAEYLTEHPQLTLSAITRYEILRGLKARGAAVQLFAFNAFCEASTVLPITDEIIDRASSIYADLYRRGDLIGDADILIAATAMEHRLALVTNNTRHYGRIADLELQNWLEP